MGHQTLKPYQSCSWGDTSWGQVSVKSGPWACGKEGLSPPGPVSLPGAALEYSRLRILCCTELAVLKSFSFLKALCAQDSSSILKQPRMHPVNSPSLLPIPNPAGGLCCKEMISVFGGQRLQEEKPSNTHYRQSGHELEDVLPHLFPGMLSSILSWLGQQLCSVLCAAVAAQHCNRASP